MEQGDNRSQRKKILKTDGRFLQEHGDAIFPGPESRSGNEVFSVCPSADVLRAFLEKRLEKKKAEQVAHHALSCRQCSRTLFAWEEIERGEAETRTIASKGLFLAGSLAAAAVIAFFLLFPGLFESPQLKAELVSASGTVRSAVFSAEDRFELKVSLPEPAYVYVLFLASDPQEREYLFPDITEETPLEGEVLLPGEGEAWKASAITPGSYLFVAGKRAKPFSREERTACLERFKKLPSEPEEQKVCDAASSWFDAVKLLPFHVQE